MRALRAAATNDYRSTASGTRVVSTRLHVRRLPEFRFERSGLLPLAFHRWAGGIAVEGAGAGGGTIAAIPWMRRGKRHLLGYMDIDGLEILNEFRASGVSAASMLMDTQAYTAFGRWYRCRRR